MGNKNTSKLVRMSIRNVGCIGNESLTVELDNIVCLVGRNNSGKSTVLRAYELAKGSAAFDVARDRCQWAKDEPSEIIIDAHIPKGIGNVDEKWKFQEDEHLIVRSRWQWVAPDFKRVRTTWNPEINDWADDGKAGGADPVFNSRLPRPIRIGSLEDAEACEKMLVTFALAPLLSEIELQKTEEQSELSKALLSVSSHVNSMSEAHSKMFNEIASKISDGFQGIFPKLDVQLSVAMLPPHSLKIDNLLKEGSGLKILDGKASTNLSQQGTGARRALFWSMLQVHNELTRDKEVRDNFKKKMADELKKEQKKTPNKQDPQLISQLQAQLKAFEEGSAIPQSADDPAFPGYLLLIDEPENALHPLAARAAQRHLYKLAESADWQVMLTTHSPYFVNPFEDHTTIVRLDRTINGKPSPITPKTYRSDSIEFEGDGKQRLQALQNLDPSLSEIFFGSYPILVEGDTEHAAFLASVLEEKHELAEQITIVRARGKANLAPLICVLRHFKIDFGIVHDADPPFRKDGTANGMWSENAKIRAEIEKAREADITVRHRVSVPDFERFLEGGEVSKDKPLNAYLRISDDAVLREKVQKLLEELLDSEQHDPAVIYAEVPATDYLEALKSKVMDWAISAGLQDTARFKGKAD